MSDGSMDHPRNFKSRSARLSISFRHRQIKRSDSPEASYVYTKKEGSMDPIWNLDDDTIPVLSYRLDSCGISEERSASLKSTLSSNPSHLRNPHLYRNKIRRHSCGEGERSDSLISSMDSIMSDGSMDPPRNFKSRRILLRRRPKKRSDASHVHRNSEVSTDPPLTHGHLSLSPLPSCGEGESSDSLISSRDSIMSDGSMDHPRNFKSRSAWLSISFRHRQIKRSDSPEASYVYTKKEGSMDPIWNLDDDTIPVLSYRLDSCGISEERSASLKSTLSSNPSHLRNPHLYRNKIRRHSW